MYSHLSALVGAERNDDDLHLAELHRRARQATMPSTLDLSTPEPGRTARVRWRRRASRQQPRPARA
jgi:hypothetical protein